MAPPKPAQGSLPEHGTRSSQASTGWSGHRDAVLSSDADLEINPTTEESSEDNVETITLSPSPEPTVTPEASSDVEVEMEMANQEPTRSEKSYPSPSTPHPRSMLPKIS